MEAELIKSQSTKTHRAFSEAFMEETERTLGETYDFWNDCETVFDMDSAYFMGGEL